MTQNSVGPPYANLQTQQILWQPYDPLPSNALTPYGNVMLMQSKMEDIKVAATSDQLVNGSGVYAVAAKDAVLPEASLMVWNYQGGCSGVGSTSGCGTAAYDTTMKLANLPNGLGDGPVTVTVYRVDQNTSNFYYDPTNTDLTKAELKQVDVHTVTPEGGGTLNFRTDLAPDTIYLFVLKGGRSAFGQQRGLTTARRKAAQSLRVGGVQHPGNVGVKLLQRNDYRDRASRPMVDRTVVVRPCRSGERSSSMRATNASASSSKSVISPPRR